MVTEVRGFTDPQKDEYFMQRFRNKPDTIISHIKSVRSLDIMSHIPIFCWILSTVLQKLLEQRRKPKLPRTLTQMYVHFLVHQAKVKNIKYQQRSSWTPETRKMVLSLSKLAFEQLQKGNLIFYQSDLRECGLDAEEAARYSGVFTQTFYNSGKNLLKTQDSSEIPKLMFDPGNSDKTLYDLDHSDFHELEDCLDSQRRDHFYAVWMSGVRKGRGCSGLSSKLRPLTSKRVKPELNHPGASAELLTALQDDPQRPLQSVRLKPAGPQYLTPGLQKYYTHITLDPDTVNRFMQLSDDQRTVTLVKEEQPYPDSAQRFEVLQVLSSSPLIGRCYWEVEWSGGVVDIAVSYSGIQRKGEREECEFGIDYKSWSLRISAMGFSVRHNNQETVVPSNASSGDSQSSPPQTPPPPLVLLSPLLPPLSPPLVHSPRGVWVCSWTLILSLSLTFLQAVQFFFTRLTLFSQSRCSQASSSLTLAVQYR
ncbi:hypothetical protein WMY93_001612 [Mugilogobius chulae]|uniref:SPRY-associated domain-containing protein n=1 Tax=Mugilogobius chulae TaxID=88201 RepID=A0AAW0Q684_9GOBI